MKRKKKINVTMDQNPEFAVAKEATFIPTPKIEKTLVVYIDGGLGRVIAMSGAITEVAKYRPVKVITSWPLVFWGNPYIVSVHGTDDRRLFEDVIKGNDYFVLEPYHDPEFFNDGVNWLNIAEKQLAPFIGATLFKDGTPQPILFLAEHEKLDNVLEGEKPILFQPFGSTMQANGADKSYRSLRVDDAQYIANGLITKGYTVYVTERDNQPKLEGCKQLTVEYMRWLVNLCARYPVLGIDSSLHHAAKAFGNVATVIWSATDPGRFGYESHNNFITPHEYHYVPFRLGVDFNTDIINQHTNEFSKEFLDQVLALY